MMICQGFAILYEINDFNSWLSDEKIILKLKEFFVFFSKVF